MKPGSRLHLVETSTMETDEMFSETVLYTEVMLS